ncbi:hypothetical protein ACQKFM_31285 [Paenibacillus xylanexedens]
MKKESVGIRLPRWMIDEVEKLGAKQEVIEKAVLLYLKSQKK